MRGYNRWDEKAKCKTENEEKCHPVQYKRFCPGLKRAEGENDGQALKPRLKCTPEKERRANRREWSDPTVKGEKRVRSDLDRKINPILPPIC